MSPLIPPTIIGEAAQPTTSGSASALALATTLFKRSDTPFASGQGTEVILSAENGFTKKGWLGVPFRFQAPPLDTVGRTMGHDWASYKVLGGEDGPKERTRSEGPKLRTVQFKAVFMDWEPEWQVWSPDELEPQLAIAELEALANAGVKFRLRIKNAALYDWDDVNMLAVITQADASEEAGEQDSRYIQLSFQEWEPTEVEVRTVKNTQGPWTHKLAPTGDTLYKLAKTYYKTQSLWHLITAANPGMANQSPSTDLRGWSARTKRTSVRIPAKPTGTTPFTAGSEVAGERTTSGISLS